MRALDISHFAQSQSAFLFPSWFGNPPTSDQQPGKPPHTTYAERLNRTVRYDWLTPRLFGSIGRGQEYAT